MSGLLKAATAAAALMLAGQALAQSGDTARVGTATRIIREGTVGIGDERYDVRRDPVFRDQLVAAGPGGLSRIVFGDDTELLVGPGAQIRLDDLNVDSDLGRTNFVLSAANGVFRFTAGNLAAGSYAIFTRDAIIGAPDATFVSIVSPDGRRAVVLEDGEAITVSLADTCKFTDGPQTLDQRGHAVIIDGCAISRPVEPPNWAQQDIAALDGLLAHLVEQRIQERADDHTENEAAVVQSAPENDPTPADGPSGGQDTAGSADTGPDSGPGDSATDGGDNNSGGNGDKGGKDKGGKDKGGKDKGGKDKGG